MTTKPSEIEQAPAKSGDSLAPSSSASVDMLAEVSAEQTARIQQTAEVLGITPQALIRMALDNFLEQTAALSYQEAEAYVFAKNAELYRRLA